MDSSFTLRVLLEPRQSDPNIWVANCLETGYVTTGLGYDEARESILDVLRSEYLYAGEHNRKLKTRSPIPANLEAKWEAVTREYPPQTIPLFPSSPDKKPSRSVGQNNSVFVARAGR